MSKNTAREEVGGKVECSGVCCDVAAVAPVGIAALLPGVVLGSRVGVGIIDERRGAGWRRMCEPSQEQDPCCVVLRLGGNVARPRARYAYMGVRREQAT